MKFQSKQLIAAFILPHFSEQSGQSGSNSMMMQVSPNNTILQNIYALSMNQSISQNATLSYISLLLGLNTSCTSNITQMLNSSSGNFTFFAPSDQAFRSIPGFPDFGPNFCDNCSNERGNRNNSISPSGGGLFARLFQSDQGSNPLRQQQSQCPKGCNDSSLSFNATSPQLMPCLSNILQYHLLNESIYFNSTSFGFLNRSSYNLTVIPTMLNSSCLVNLWNSSSGNMNETMPSGGGAGISAQQEGDSSGSSDNYQVLVFNITNTSSNSSNPGGMLSGASSSSSNVTILHGINKPGNVTVFDIQSSNGVLHVIDALLIPPANMTDTIKYTFTSLNATNNSSTSFDSSGAQMNSTSSSSSLPSFLNQTDLQMYNNMSGITVFLPDSNTNNTNTSFNLTNFIFPSLLYNNRSFEIIGNLSDGVFFQQNLTNLNGDNVTVLFGRNNAMLFNGSRVTQSNILMKNGVLHLFTPSESTFESGNNNTTTTTTTNNNNNGPSSALGLGRILRQ